MVIYDFPITQTAKSEKIDMEIMGINDLMIIDTSLFAYKGSGHNDFFEIYSTNNLQYLEKFLSQGRGPGEFLSIQFTQNYFLKNGDLVLWVSDGALQKYIPGNISLSVQNQHTGETTSERNFFKSYIPESIPIPLLSMGIAKHPEKDLFAGNILFFNQINIFSPDMKTNFSISYQPPIDIFKTAKLPDPDFILYYSSLHVSSEYIYALYLNKKNNLFSYAEGATELHVFDWEGAPITKIQIPDNIIYFAVYEIHHYIYGLKGNEELFRYKFEI